MNLKHLLPTEILREARPGRCHAGICRLPVVACMLAAGLAGCEKPKPPAPPPSVVQVMTVNAQDVPIKQTWVATLASDVNADIRAQVSGYLLKQVYQNGQFVKTGDLLFQIDPRPFQAALDQAKGNLAQAQAQLTKDKLNAQRAMELYKKQVISQEQYDDQIQAYQASKASAEAASAAVEQAQLNLDFTSITAPVDGLTSIATAQVGDLVGPSTGTLATVVKVDPVKVNFMVAEQDYVKFIEKYFGDPSQSPIGTGGRLGMPLSLVLTDGTTYPMGGELKSVNNVVGIDTGSLSMQGEFPNPGRLLRPGQFGLVTATTGIDKGAIVVPQRAIIDLQGTSMMAVVGADNKVDIRTVTLGPTIGSDQIVTKGVSSGDRVVVEGLQKVKQGAVVNPQPYVETQQEKDSDDGTTPAATPPQAKG